MTTKRNLERRLETVEDRMIESARAHANSVPMVVPECAHRDPIADDPLIREDGVVNPGRGIPMFVEGSAVYQKIMKSEIEETN